MTENKTCRVCDIVLDSENWYPSYKNEHKYICKKCARKINKQWREANPDKMTASYARAKIVARKRGVRQFDKNKECSMFLGVHIAERVLSKVFKDVVRMPINNHGYDFICSKDKLIEVKSACQRGQRGWGFHIRRNTIADYFLCLAFDNRKDLTPLHAWLLPGNKFNHLTEASIRPNTISRWDPYRLDISKISDCCDAMRGD